jgi:hypothetical protein
LAADFLLVPEVADNSGTPGSITGEAERLGCSIGTKSGEELHFPVVARAATLVRNGEIAAGFQTYSGRRLPVRE